MSMNAQGFGGGGSVADATETTAGKIRIATSAEAATGTSDVIAMTPLTVKERIDASLVGVFEYKGTFNATAGTPSIANAEQGDVYVIDTAGTIYGQDWNIGDHLLINADMGGSVTNSKIDKVDNTDSDASETVKGIIEIATNAEAGAGSATDKALVPSNVSSLSLTSGQVAGLATVATSGAYSDLSGTPTLATVATTGAYSDLSGTPTLATVATTGAYSDLSGTPTLGTAAALDVGTAASNVVQLDGSAKLPAVDGSQLTNLPSGNQIVDVEIKTASSFTASSNYIYLCGYTSGTQTITFPAASSSNDGDLIALSSNNGSRSISIVSSDGTTNDIVDVNNTAKGGTNGGLSLDIDRQLVWFSPSGTSWRQLNGALATVATTGAYSDLSGTPTLATVATTGAYSDLSGTPTLATVATSGAYSDLSGLPTLGTAASSDTSDFLASTAGLDDLSDVSFTAGAGIDNYVLTYDNSTTSWGAEAVPSAPVTSVNSLTGAVTISGDDVAADHTATNYTAANANVDGHFSGVDTALGNKQPLDAGLTSISGLTTSADKMLYTTASDTYAVADLTSAGRALLDDADAAAQRTTLGLGTAATSASTDFLASTAGLNDLSDVSFTAGAGIDNYVLTYDHSTTSWGAEAAASGGGQPNLTVVASTSYTLSAANAPNIYIWYGASNSSTFTVTMPAIADVISDIASVGGSPAETFEVHIGRGQGGDITVSASNGIDLLGDGSVTYSTTQTINAGEWIKLIGWKTSASNARYLMNSPISGLTNLSDVTITSAASGNLLEHNGTAFVNVTKSAIDVGSFNDDGTYLKDVIEDTTPQLGGDLDVNANEIVSASNNNVILRPNGTGVVQFGGNTNPAEIRLYCESGDAHYVGLKSPAHASLSGSQTWTLPTADGTSGQVIQTNGSGVLSFVDQSGGAGGGWTYSAITADPANAQAGYHYSCTGSFTITLPTSGVSSGEEIRVKNMGTGTITIDPQTQNIDGSTTDYVMDVQYSAITLVSTGSHWEVI